MLMLGLAVRMPTNGRLPVACMQDGRHNSVVLAADLSLFITTVLPFPSILNVCDDNTLNVPDAETVQPVEQCAGCAGKQQQG